MKPSGLLVLPNLSPPHHHTDKELAFLFLFVFFSPFFTTWYLELKKYKDSLDLCCSSDAFLNA